MNNTQFEKEEQSYHKAVDSIAEILEIEERIQNAEERSAGDMEERRRILEQDEFMSRQARAELDERYRKNLEEQIRLHEERVELLERLATELKEYQDRHEEVQKEFEKEQPVELRENKALLDEGVKQTLMDVSAVRRANLEALIENNPAWKRFVAPESYVQDEVVNQRVALEGRLLVNHYEGRDFTPDLAKPIGGPGRGFQAALRELDDPQKVVRVASFALDIEGTYDPTLPSKSEFDLAKDYLNAKTVEERDELVNGELTGPGLPLQWALSEVDPGKRDKVCIETLKGYGIDTTEFEKEKGQVKVPEAKTLEFSPREKELSHVATLSTKIESPLVTPENELAVDLSLQKDNSLQMERD